MYEIECYGMESFDKTKIFRLRRLRKLFDYSQPRMIYQMDEFKVAEKSEINNYMRFPSNLHDDMADALALSWISGDVYANKQPKQEKTMKSSDTKAPITNKQIVEACVECITSPECERLVKGIVKDLEKIIKDHKDENHCEHGYVFGEDYDKCHCNMICANNCRMTYIECKELSRNKSNKLASDLIDKYIMELKISTTSRHERLQYHELLLRSLAALNLKRVDKEIRKAIDILPGGKF